MLEVRTLPVPPPGRGQLRIRVEAAGISHADLLVMRGVHPERPRAPFVPGWDAVGTVESLGPGVCGPAPGERVAGLTITGGWAEHVIVPVRWAVPVPTPLSSTEAVCAVMDSVVAYQMLTRTAALGAGRTVLVQGGGGGVGAAVLRLAGQLDLRVMATDRTDKIDHLERMGAIAIDVERDEPVTRCLDLTDGRGVDAVLDGVGSTLWSSYAMLAPGGTLVVFGLTAFLRGGRRHREGMVSTVSGGFRALARSLAPSEDRRVRLYSIQHLARRHPDRYRHDLETLLRWAADGRSEPCGGRLLALDQVPDAASRLALGWVSGKQVVTIAATG